MSGLCDNCDEWFAELHPVQYCGVLCADCRDAEIKRQQDGPMGEDSEPDLNAESGRERQIKEFQEKYR